MMFFFFMDGMDNYCFFRQGFIMFLFFFFFIVIGIVLKFGFIIQRLGNLEIFLFLVIIFVLLLFILSVLFVFLLSFIFFFSIMVFSIVIIYQDVYFKRLQRNFMFKDFQNLLVQECLYMQVLINLIDFSFNNSVIKLESCQLFLRYMKFQEKFLVLRVVESLRFDGLNLESAYSGEVGQIEVSRYQVLCVVGIFNQYRRVVNYYYDQRRLNFIN